MPAAQAPFQKVALHEGSDEAQPTRSQNLKALAARRRLEDLGTTAKREGWQANSEWCGDMEYVWRERLSLKRQSLTKRARRLRAKANVLKPPPTTKRWVCPPEPPPRRGVSTWPQIMTSTRAQRRRWYCGAVPELERAPLCPYTAMYRVALLRSAEWCEERARAMAMQRTDVVATCRERTRVTTCDCTTLEVRVGCDAPLLCTWCRQRHWRRWRRKITKALNARVRAARARWFADPDRSGMPPGVYLITLTGKHSGDLTTDRERMGRAVRGLLKYAHLRGWWSHYALTWEVTAGTIGDGHVHCHMAVVSSWIPYTCDKGDAYGPRAPFRQTHWVRKRYQRTPAMGLHEAWRHYMPGAEVLDVQAPNRYRKRGKTPSDYLAKYVTKGIEPTEMSGRKAGEMLVAFRGRRKLSTSRDFWVPEAHDCRACGKPHRMLEAPCSLQTIAPAAVLRSMSERTRYRDVTRFVFQVQLRGADDTPLI